MPKDGTESKAREAGQMNCSIFVGLDVHKTTVSVAVAEGRAVVKCAMSGYSKTGPMC